MTAVRAILLAAAVCVAVLCFKLYYAGSVLATLRDTGPRIATIDFYGLQDVTPSHLRAKLGLRVGDPAPVQLNEPDLFMRFGRPLFGVQTTQSLESKLHEIPGVGDAAIVNVQESDPHRVSVFVGVSQNDVVPARPAFHGNAVLPETVVGLYDRHGEAFGSAATNHSQDLDEDDSRGYALFTDAAMRAMEEKAIVFVQSPQNRDAALTALQTSADVRQRRAAAWLLSYGPDPQQTGAALADALDDPDGEVRNTACRALAVIAAYGVENAALRIRVAPGRLIRMLSSLIWTDRDKAMGVLDSLTAARDSETLMQLKRSGLGSLVEMARWNAISYARMAYRLIGRIAGLTDADIERTWNEGDAARERVIRTAQAH